MAVSLTPQAPDAPGTLPINGARAYRYHWRDYATRRGVAKFMVFTWPVVAIGGFVVSRLYLHVPEIVIPAILAWLGLAYAAIWFAGEFRCPRCRRRFGALNARKGLGVIWRGLFDDICYNCKLRKFTNG